MTSSEAIHEVLTDHEEFGELLRKLDSPDSVDELRATVDLHGGKTAEVFEYDLQELRDRELGLIRLLWEAHHKEDNSENIKTHQ